MSWQCPICETVNQDVAPICTVCDHLAPVIDSYLSLESIESLRDYNTKLTEVHSFEVVKDYAAMLETAIQAMSLYKDNGLAIEKARQAIIKLQETQLENKIVGILEDAISKKNLNLASGILKIVDMFEVSDDKIEELGKDIKKKIARKRDVDEILQRSYLALIDLKTEDALKIVEEGLLIHAASKRLQIRRSEIQTFIRNLNERKDKGVYSKSLRPRPKPKTPTLTDKEERISDGGEKDSEKIGKVERKFPKIKRNN